MQIVTMLGECSAVLTDDGTLADSGASGGDFTLTKPAELPAEPQFAQQSAGSRSEVWIVC